MRRTASYGRWSWTRRDQIDGYRFVYLLPFGPNEIFVEDTYYSDTPCSTAALRARIAAYAGAGLAGTRGVPAGERGAAGGDRRRLRGVLALDRHRPGEGRDAGCAVPPHHRLLAARRRAAGRPDRGGRPTSPLGSARADPPHAAQTWAGRGFYRALDTMLFRAAEPDQPLPGAGALLPARTRADRSGSTPPSPRRRTSSASCPAGPRSRSVGPCGRSSVPPGDDPEPGMERSSAPPP